MYTSTSPVLDTAARWLAVASLVGVLVGIGGAGLQPAVGQASETDGDRYSVALRDVPLDEALQQFVQQTRADIAYSNALVQGRTTYCRTRNASTEALLECVLSGTGVDYLRTSGGTYLLVEEVRAPDASGHIAGTVVDAATGEPLPRANVLLADASAGTSTNQDGRFRFASVLAGHHRLVVTYVGYSTAVDTIWVPSDGRRSVRIALEPSVLQGDPLVVDGLQQRLPSAALGRNETSLDDLRSAGGVGTLGALRSASRQTGVTLNRPRTELSVQGGGDGENVTLLDGTPIREPTTLGGLLSAFSPAALDRITVHKTGFGAEHGSYTSGVVETTHDLRSADASSRRPSARVTADPVSLNGRFDTAWSAGPDRPGQAMGAVRRSVWEAYRAPSLHRLLNAWTQLDPTLTAWWVSPAAPTANLLAQQPSAAVQFTDLHAAVRQSLSPFHELSVSVYHGTNEVGTTVGSVLSGDGAQRLLISEGRNGWENTAAQARYGWIAGARTTGALQLYVSRHDSHTFFGLRDSVLAPSSDFEGGMPDDLDLSGAEFNPQDADHSAEGNRLTEVGGRAQVDVSVSPQYRLEAAVEPRVFRGAFHIRNRFLGALGHEARTWQVGSYVQGTASLGLGTTATLGTRLTYIPDRASVYAEPRLSVRLDRSQTAVGDLAVRVAGGLYRQYVLQADVSNGGPTAVVPSMQFWLPLDGSLAPPRAYHAAADVLVRPTETWTLRLETYAKWQPRTVSVDYAGLVRSTPLPDTRLVAQRTVARQSDLFAVGDGRALGAALRVQRDGNRVSGTVQAEVSRVHRRYPGRFGGRFVPAPWETPLQLSADLDVKVLTGVHALASWQGQWNRPWALRRAYYDYVAPTGGVDGVVLDRPAEQRLAPFSRVDLGLRAETTVRGVTLETRASVVNVFDRANPFDWSLDTAGPAPQPVPRTLPGRRIHLQVGVRL